MTQMGGDFSMVWQARLAFLEQNHSLLNLTHTSKISLIMVVFYLLLVPGTLTNSGVGRPSCSHTWCSVRFRWNDGICV